MGERDGGLQSRCQCRYRCPSSYLALCCLGVTVWCVGGCGLIVDMQGGIVRFSFYSWLSLVLELAWGGMGWNGVGWDENRGCFVMRFYLAWGFGFDRLGRGGRGIVFCSVLF